MFVMKKTIVPVLLVMLLGLGISHPVSAQKKGKSAAEVKRGINIDAKGAINTKEMQAIVERDKGFEGKVTAKITACCQNKGCWMMVDLENGKTMRVTFKDYGFFVPKDCPGKTVIMQGRAYTDTTSVEMLQHYAKDAGKSKAEIDAITQPEVNLAFEADGLILTDGKK